MRSGWAAVLLLGCCSTMSSAHYNMLLPEKAQAKKGEKVQFTYQFGHPFEHELFDAPRPMGLVVLLPSGKKEILDVEKELRKFEVPGAEGKRVTTWRFDYTPAERGDHVFVLKTAQIKLEEGYSVEDVVKVILHVQTQNNWDTLEEPYESGLDILPYTRPYGLLPGMLFRGRVIRLPSKKRDERQEVNGLHVEIERYFDRPMKNLPPDELITFQTKTDREGFFVTTLPEAGWWGVTALTRLKNGGTGQQAHQVRQRATLWIHVDEKR